MYYHPYGHSYVHQQTLVGTSMDYCRHLHASMTPPSLNAHAHYLPSLLDRTLLFWTHVPIYTPTCSSFKHSNWSLWTGPFSYNPLLATQRLFNLCVWLAGMILTLFLHSYLTCKTFASSSQLYNLCHFCSLSVMYDTGHASSWLEFQFWKAWWGIC